MRCCTRAATYLSQKGANEDAERVAKLTEANDNVVSPFPHAPIEHMDTSLDGAPAPPEIAPDDADAT